MTTQEIFEERGYIVFGSNVSFEVGQVIPCGEIRLANNAPQETALLVTAETDRADWLAQEVDGGELMRIVAPHLAHYYRVIAE